MSVATLLRFVEEGFKALAWFRADQYLPCFSLCRVPINHYLPVPHLSFQDS